MSLYLSYEIEFTSKIISIVIHILHLKKNEKVVLNHL